MQRFDDHPVIAIWETTRACDLACKHCRASAVPARDPAELSTEEGKRLLDSLARAGVPIVILTGGDPAKREDLIELVAHGRKVGLHMGLTPSATPLVTPALIERLAEAGLTRLAISIDAPDAARHDAFRGVSGSFDQSLRILAAARSSGIATQINTSVHTANIDLLEGMVPLVEQAGCVLWSAFFVVPTGRASSGMMPDPDRVERALEWLAELTTKVSFGIKTTAAPHYRRVLLARKRGQSHATRGLDTLRVNEGRGFMFVSHRGDVFPSGFLPIPCGNVRDADAVELYRSSELLRSLRDSSRLLGKCGACEYRRVCGGSRARAYATTGNPLEADPLCAYVPKHYDASRSTPAQRRLTVLAP